ncbi:MAG: hypothetical protein WAW82_00155 [Candidatus Lutibacillus vidarii]|nr:hypothetical protein [Candidatus Lutibacillus vidarii]
MPWRLRSALRWAYRVVTAQAGDDDGPWSPCRCQTAPALLAGLLDYAENVVIWSLLVRWPGTPGMLAEVGGAVTSAKRVVATVAVVIPLVLGGARAWRRLRTRRHTQG